MRGVSFGDYLTMNYLLGFPLDDVDGGFSLHTKLGCLGTFYITSIDFSDLRSMLKRLFHVNMHLSPIIVALLLSVTG